MTPIEGVIFDFNFTLVHQGDPADWLDRACRRIGRRPVADAAVLAFLDDIWAHAQAVDPLSRRDTSQAMHREVFDLTMAGVPGVDTALAAALYDCLLDIWVAYDDAGPTLEALRQAGVRVAVLSNIGIDIRPVLRRDGLADLLDAVVLSYQVGCVKPEPGIFARTLQELGVAADRALMVGDSWRADAGAAVVGIRSLILPRTSGPEHGLDAVLRLVG